VNEDILAAIVWGDEAITTTTIETDNGTDRHGITSRVCW
jgi:hypothetical protein